MFFGYTMDDFHCNYSLRYSWEPPLRNFRSMTLVCIHLMANNSYSTEPASKQTVVHANAHAHNDYYHPRPLLDALDQGFGSVEADVFLVEGELLVAHSSLETRRERTLEKLYLEPLAERCQANGGRVYREGPELMLLVDLKSEAEAAYAKLQEKLVAFESMLTKLVDGKVAGGAVRIVVSGNRPVETMATQTSRLAFLDGRMSDLDSNSPIELAPVVSDQWSSHFKWRGRDAMPKDEIDKLNALVARAHEQKRKLRFWGAPDNPATWEQLTASGVDLINTDKLQELAEFLAIRK